MKILWLDHFHQLIFHTCNIFDYGFVDKRHYFGCNFPGNKVIQTTAELGSLLFDSLMKRLSNYIFSNLASYCLVVMLVLIYLTGALAG